MKQNAKSRLRRFFRLVVGPSRPSLTHEWTATEKSCFRSYFASLNSTRRYV